MHVVIRHYTSDAKNFDEVVALLRNSFASLIGESRGFVSYVVAQGLDGSSDFVTTSTFEDRAGTDASVELAAEWAKVNLAKLTLAPPQITVGEVLIDYVKEHRPARWAVMRTYTGISHVDEIYRRVNANLLPLLAESPGLASYRLIDAGAGIGVTSSAYADRHSAEAAGLIIRQWVKGNLGDLVPDPPAELLGDIKLRIVPAGVLV